MKGKNTKTTKQKVRIVSNMSMTTIQQKFLKYLLPKILIFWDTKIIFLWITIHNTLMLRKISLLSSDAFLKLNIITG